MKIELYPEICCDYCNDVIHNHFDCPACKKQYAGTDAYGEIDGDFYDSITCESCGAKFKLVSMNGWRDEWEWERVENEN